MVPLDSCLENEVAVLLGKPATGLSPRGGESTSQDTMPQPEPRAWRMTWYVQTTWMKGCEKVIDSSMLMNEKTIRSLRLRRIRYGGQVVSLPFIGSHIRSRPSEKFKSLMKVNGFQGQCCSRLPKSTGFSLCPARAETASGLRCTKIVRKSKRE